MGFSSCVVRVSVGLLAIGVTIGGAGAGGQRLTPPVLVATGSWPAAISAGDVNGDGQPDLIVVDAGATAGASTTRVLLNGGGGKFTASATVATAGSSILAAEMVQGAPVSLEWVQVSAQVATIYRANGNGDGTFLPAVVMGTFAVAGSKPGAFQIAAANYRMARREVVLEDTANLNLYEALSLPDGSTVVYPLEGLPSLGLIAGAAKMMVADLNGDGYTDVVVQGSQGVEVFLGTNDGLETVPTVYPCTGTVNSILLADMDGDGRVDLLVEGAGGRIDIYHGNGDGTFAAVSEIGSGASSGLTGNGGHLVGVADFDGDGNLDLVTGTAAGINVLLGQKGLSYRLFGTVYAGPGDTSYVFADLNGDGRMDVGVDAPGGVNVLYAADGSMQSGGTLTAAPEPSVYGVGITLTATLTGAKGSAAPTGTVEFFIDGTDVGPGAVVNGVATESITAAMIATPITNAIYWDGTHVLSANYSGDLNYVAATLKGSHTVVGQPTVTTLTQLDQNIFYGQEIGYDNGVNALVDAMPADPANVVAGTSLVGADLVVYIDGKVVCMLPYGLAEACPDPPFEGFDAGQHTTYTMYQGNEYYAASVSANYTVTIAPDPTMATLTSSLNPSVAGEAVTFTATISDVYHVAVGTVSFLDGNAVIGTGTLDGNGVATFTTSTLTVGNHPIHVIYAASQDFLGSVAALPLPMGQEVDTVVPPPPPPPGSFTLTVNPTAISVGVGNVVAVQVTVVALNGYSQPVQLGCTGLPHETTCMFGQSLIGAGGGTTTMLVSPAAPHTCGSSTPDFIAPNVRMGLGVLGLVGLFGLRRRRRRVLKALVLVVGLCMLPGLSGCSDGCKDFGTEPGLTYSFTVSATSTGTPMTAEMQAVTMKVHL
jgi:MYXO-CTERM domain-containing protein